MRLIAKTSFLEINFTVAIAILGLQSPSPASNLTVIKNFSGQGFTRVYPSDANGDVDSQYYLQAVNNSVSSIGNLYDKNTGKLVKSVTFSDLAPPDSGITPVGDPIVLYDGLAKRWLMTEMSDVPAQGLTTYISKGENFSTDPTQWNFHQFSLDNFPDYPKYAIGTNAYYVSANLIDSNNYLHVFALDKKGMLSGNPRPSIDLSAPAFGSDFQAFTPATITGSNIPPDDPSGYFMRYCDNEVNTCTNGSKNTGEDYLELWSLKADFDHPDRSSFIDVADIPIADFVSDFSSVCITQSGSDKHPDKCLDAVREVIMNRLQYRDFGGYESLSGNFTVNDNGLASIRWFELRKPVNSLWSLYQEGTFRHGNYNTWMGAIAMDGGGNILLGYSFSDDTIHPSFGYTGRKVTDELAMMTEGANTLINGSGDNFSEYDDNLSLIRWGDYHSTSIDPSDDKTFWLTGNYVGSDNHWATEIAAIRFSSVPEPNTIVGLGIFSILSLMGRRGEKF